MSSQVTIVSTETMGHDKVVKIAVSGYGSLSNYKPGKDEITIVVASESCPEEDLKAIEHHCQFLDYSYLRRQQVGESSSVGTNSNDGAGGSINEEVKK